MSFSILTQAAFGRFRIRRKAATAKTGANTAPLGDAATAGGPNDNPLDERIARIISEIPRRRVRHHA